MELVLRIILEGIRYQIKSHLMVAVGVSNILGELCLQLAQDDLYCPYTISVFIHAYNVSSESWVAGLCLVSMTNCLWRNRALIDCMHLLYSNYKLSNSDMKVFQEPIEQTASAEWPFSSFAS